MSALKFLHRADTVIATVGIVKEEVVVAPVVEGEEPAEPELIAKGKKDDEGLSPRRARRSRALPIFDCRLPICDLTEIGR